MSPNCECGHERGDHGPKMWGCAHCPCTEYEARTPATSPTPSASPEADGRCDGENYTRTTSGSRQWIDCRVCGEFEVVPKSELARVQRERDEARLCAKYETDVAEQAIADMEKAEKDRETSLLFAEKRMQEVWLELAVVRLEELGYTNLSTACEDRDGFKAACEAMAPADMLADLQHENAALRAQLASALDAARKELQSAQRDLDAALDRARVAEQRIETGEIRWRDKSGTYLLSDPSGWTRAARELYGPFTRGRFVADQENGQ